MLRATLLGLISVTVFNFTQLPYSPLCLVLSLWLSSTLHSSHTLHSAWSYLCDCLQLYTAPILSTLLGLISVTVFNFTQLPYSPLCLVLSLWLSSTLHSSHTLHSAWSYLCDCLQLYTAPILSTLLGLISVTVFNFTQLPYSPLCLVLSLWLSSTLHSSHTLHSAWSYLCDCLQLYTAPILSTLLGLISVTVFNFTQLPYSPLCLVLSLWLSSTLHSSHTLHSAWSYLCDCLQLYTAPILSTLLGLISVTVFNFTQLPYSPLCLVLSLWLSSTLHSSHTLHSAWSYLCDCLQLYTAPILSTLLGLISVTVFNFTQLPYSPLCLVLSLWLSSTLHSSHTLHSAWSYLCDCLQLYTAPILSTLLGLISVTVFNFTQLPYSPLCLVLSLWLSSTLHSSHTLHSAWSYLCDCLQLYTAPILSTLLGLISVTVFNFTQLPYSPLCLVLSLWLSSTLHSSHTLHSAWSYLCDCLQLYTAPILSTLLGLISVTVFNFTQLPYSPLCLVLSLWLSSTLHSSHTLHSAWSYLCDCLQLYTAPILSTLLGLISVTVFNFTQLPYSPLCLVLSLWLSSTLLSASTFLIADFPLLVPCLFCLWPFCMQWPSPSFPTKPLSGLLQI